MPTGLDRLARDPRVQDLLRGGRFALLAHAASVTQDLVHVSDVLAGLSLRPARIFGPEHGYGGEAQDMIGVADARDARGIPVRSLYGASVEDLEPRPADLDGLDAILVDLEDVGARYYTFVWTALLVLRACHARGVRVIVLDRPNPIGHTLVEGRLQEAGFRSFVGLEPVPVRHALTLGEILAHRAAIEGLEGALAIVPAARDLPAPFVMPSPNMPTIDTALVYPGGCLLEGTNLSEGRGTTRPFEITGAPWLDGRLLADALSRTGLPGFVARPLTFSPTFHKHAGKTCGGVQIHVTDPTTFRPYATYLALVAIAHHHHPADFRFRTERYEFVDDIPAFDLLTGNAEARTRILAGDVPAAITRDVSHAGEAEVAIVRDARAQAERRAVSPAGK
jgi:uncharacterized protein YbbC (DUF1343 family)